MCFEFGVIHVRQMTCRDASAFWSREGDEGLSRVRERLYRLLPLLLLKCILEIHVEKGI